jgi:plastocyanin
MRKSSAVLVAVVAAFALTAVAASSASARTFYVYRAAFSPSIAEEQSGVSVRFFNVDSVPHRIVSYQTYGARVWALDITLQPWQGYTVPSRFSCTGPCWSDLYPFRDANGSTLAKGSDGIVHCQGYCGELWLYP